MFDVPAAMKEVQAKSEPQIEVETAYKWASRALACYQLYRATRDLAWFLRAEQYRHEAFEHAAVAGDEGHTLQSIEVTIGKFRP